MSDEVQDSMLVKSAWLRRFIAKKISSAAKKKVGIDIDLTFLNDIDISIDNDTASMQAFVSIDIPKKELQKLLKTL